MLQDWWEMFIHHLATLALLTLSWTTQMFRSGTVVTPSDVYVHVVRIGSLVILVHDFADHWMELAKMAKYAGFSVGHPHHHTCPVLC